jgi:hypothetical protein
VVVGVNEVLAERTPAEKLDAVRLERRRAPVIMTGDGINDAPALALADVGVALGARGAGASAEVADGYPSPKPCAPAAIRSWPYRQHHWHGHSHRVPEGL